MTVKQAIAYAMADDVQLKLLTPLTAPGYIQWALG